MLKLLKNYLIRKLKVPENLPRRTDKLLPSDYYLRKNYHIFFQSQEWYKKAVSWLCSNDVISLQDFKKSVLGQFYFFPSQNMWRITVWDYSDNQISDLEDILLGISQVLEFRYLPDDKNYR